MAGSLQDQFLKAGLVSQKQAKKAQHEARKGKKQKGKGKAAPPPATPAQDAERKAKAERDRALNQARVAEQRKREAEAQANDLMARHKTELPEGEVAFNFQDAGRIRTLYINEETRARLVAGTLALVGTGETFASVPADIAARIAERSDEFIKLWNRSDDDASSGDDGKDDPDDPYAEYTVPDDLVW